jgi:predicted  nucleic acid-binding Zn-ribbon protein
MAKLLTLDRDMEKADSRIEALENELTEIRIKRRLLVEDADEEDDRVIDIVNSLQAGVRSEIFTKLESLRESATHARIATDN